MITGIFTETERTTLTIETSEALILVEMGREGAPIELKPGVNTISVGAGVFKVISTSALRVNADSQFYVASAKKNKDGPFPDPPKVNGLDSGAVRTFFAEAKSQLPPR